MVGRLVNSAPAPIDPVVPVAVAALAIALFVGMDASMKAVTLAIGVYNAMLWRSLAGLAGSGAIWLAVRRPWPAPATMRVHLVRGGVTTVMALAWFWGIARLPLAEAIALSFIAPLIALYLAAAVLSERVGPKALGGSLLGFAGVLAIVLTRANAPMSADGLAGAAAILASAVLYAFNIVLMRKQALIAKPVEVAFFQNLIAAALLVCAAPFLAELPPPGQVPGVLLSAGLALASALLLAWAYRRAEAQALAPVEYTALIWGALFGFLVFGEEVGAMTLVGGALIVAGCWIAARPDGQPQSPAEAAT